MKSLRLAAVLLVAGLTVGVAPTSATADDETPTLSGYQGTAAAAGIQVEYVPEGALPLPSLIDIAAPDAVATISSGPSTFAQAAAADPGDLLTNPDALLTLFSSQYPSGTIPPLPLRVAANSSFGAPVAESNLAPGFTSRAEAQPTASAARAYSPQVDGGAIAQIGSLSAIASTSLSGDAVSVRAQSKAGGVRLLNVLTIDAITTDITASSNGTDTKLSGGTKVVNAEFMGRAVTIDRNGIRFNKNTIALPNLLGSGLNNALKAAGVRITFSGPQEIDTKRTGRLASSGLRIDFAFTSRSIGLLANLFDSLPPLDNPFPAPIPGPEDIFAALQANNVGAIEIGRAVVDLATRTGGDPTDGDSFDDTGVLDDATSGFGDGGFALPDLGTGSLNPLPSLVTQKPVATTTSGSATQAGIGAFVLLALLLQPFFGKALSQFSQAVLAPAGAEHCDSEEQ